MKKRSNICSWFGSGKWFWLSIVVHVAVAAERRSSRVHRKMVLAQHNCARCRGCRKAQQPCAVVEKSVLNMI